MDFEADAIVVGTGPSGVSVAFPMLQAGMRVVLLDGGRQRDDNLVPSGAYHDLRRNDAEQWRRFLGPGFEALRSSGPPSPKFDVPGSRFAYEDFGVSQRIDGNRFTVVGSLARGGLSTIWGAGVSVYDADDLAEFPLTLSDLATSYRAVAERIGVAGFSGDDLASPLDTTIPTQPATEIGENARRVFDRYKRRRHLIQRSGVRMGRPRTAVLTVPREGRSECNLCNSCLWGCERGSIYDASQDVRRLAVFKNLDYRPGHLADKILDRPGGYAVMVRTPEGARRSVGAPVLVLAASTFATTRLVLEWQGRFDERVPVVTSPTLGFALCLPERIGAELSTREFTMAHLAFSASGPKCEPGDSAFGSLFPASGLPAWLVIERMPLTRPSSIIFYRYLQPALLLGNCFLPGRYSRDTVELRRMEDAHLVVTGGSTADLPRRLSYLHRQLARTFRLLGTFLLPGSFTLVPPGEGLRYAGTFPMRAHPGRGEVDSFCELWGAPRMHLVDLSVFPTIPAKHASLTLMANADRVGRRIAERWSTGR